MAITLPDIVQRVVLDVDRPIRASRQLTTETERLGDELEDTAKSSRTLARDQEGAARALQRTGERARDARGRFVRLNDALEDTNRETEQVNRRSTFLSRVMGDLGKSLAFTRGQTGRLFEAFRLLRFPAIILGVQLLSEAIAALSGSVLGLVGAIAPLGGLLATLPGLITPLIGAFAAGALGAMGMGDALDLYTKAQEAAKDTSWADAQADAAKTVADAQKLVSDATAEVNRLMREGTWEEIVAAQEAQASAQEALASAQERQSDVTRRAGSAQSEYEQALSKMHPAARAFIEQLNAMRPVIEDLRRSVQGGLFPGLTEALRAVTPLIRAIEPILVEFGRGLGTLASEAARMMAEPAFRGAFLDFMSDAARNLVPLGRAALDLASGFMAITSAAQPLTDWVVGLVSDWAQLWGEQQRVNEESGRTAGFFDTVRQTAELVGPIIADIGRILRDVLAASAPLGRALLETFGALLDRTAEFTGSVEGQTALRDYFMRGLPAMLEFFRLIADIGKAIFTIGSEEGLGPLLAQIRTEFLPVLLELLRTVSGPLGSALVEMATEGLRIFTQLAGTSGPLYTFVEVLTDLFRVVGNLVENVPGLRSFVFLLLTGGGALRAFKLLGMVTGVSRLLKVLNPTTGALGEFVTGLRKAKRAAPDAGKGAQTAGKGLAGTLGSLIKIHPVATLVITAIAAIGGALYALYRNNEGFRKFIDRLWQTIQRVWDRILDVVQPAAKAFIGFIGDIIDFVRGNWPTIWGIIKPVIDFIVGSFNFLKGVAVVAFKLLWAAAKDSFEILRGVWDTIGRPVLDKVSGWFDTFKTQAKAAWEFIRDNVIAPLGRAWDALSGPVGAAFNAIGEAISTGITFIRGVIRGFLGAVANVLDTIGLDNIALAIRDMIAAPAAPQAARFVTPGGAIAMAQGGLVPATVGAGFRTAVPRAIVGEGNPGFAEYVIPTDPRYRRNALALLANLTRDLGMQGGGVVEHLRDAVIRSIPALGPLAISLRDSLPGLWPRYADSGDMGHDMLGRVFNEMRHRIFHIAGVEGYQAGGVLGAASRGARGLRSSVARASGPRTLPGGSSTTIRHGDTFQVAVNTVDRPTGERLGRDIAWALIGSRGSAVQRVVA